MAFFTYVAEVGLEIVYNETRVVCCQNALRVLGVYSTYNIHNNSNRNGNSDSDNDNHSNNDITQTAHSFWKDSLVVSRLRGMSAALHRALGMRKTTAQINDVRSGINGLEWLQLLFRRINWPPKQVPSHYIVFSGHGVI